MILAWKLCVCALASPLGAVVELVQQAVSQQRAVLVDEQVLAAVDAHQEADDV